MYLPQKTIGIVPLRTGGWAGAARRANRRFHGGGGVAE
jgi:hypothetical protein